MKYFVLSELQLQNLQKTSAHYATYKTRHAEELLERAKANSRAIELPRWGVINDYQITARPGMPLLVGKEDGVFPRD